MKKLSKKQLIIIIAAAVAVLLTAVIVFVAVKFGGTDTNGANSKGDGINDDPKYNIDEMYEYGEEDISEDPETGISYINNIIIVDFDWGTTDEKKAETVAALGGKAVGGIEGYNELHIEVKKSTLSELQKMCDEVNKNQGVYASFDEIVELQANSAGMPNDPWKPGEDTFPGWNTKDYSMLSSNWWALATEINEAWKYNDYFKHINIGVMDLGFDAKHEDFDGVDFQIISKENSPKHHGTNVAGIIGAKENNGKGISGIVWNKTLYGYDLQKKNSNTFSESEIYNALEKLVKKGCKVINASVGRNFYERDGVVYSDENCRRPITEKNIKNWSNTASRRMGLLLEKGYDFVIVQSAGNGAKNNEKGQDTKYNGYFTSISDDNCYSTPSWSWAKNKVTKEDIQSRVIAVSSAQMVQKNNNTQYMAAPNSNGGQNVDIAAPGVCIYTIGGDSHAENTAPKPNDYYDNFGGTSAAAPIVAGIASLVWSVNDSFSGAEVKNIVCSSYDERFDVSDNPASTATGGNFHMVNGKLAVEEAIERTKYRGTLAGTVKDEETSEPIEGIKVNFYSKEDGALIGGTTTDKDGNFSISLPAGSYTIKIGEGSDKYKTYETSAKVEADVITTFYDEILITAKKGNEAEESSGGSEENTNGKPSDKPSNGNSSSGGSDNTKPSGDNPGGNNPAATDPSYFYYNISNNQVTIKGLKNENAPKKIVIPSTIEGYPVTKVAERAFDGDINLEELTIGDNVTAFEPYNCGESFYNLKAINVSSGNKAYSSVDGVLFNKAKTELLIYPRVKTNTSYTVPNGVTKIGRFAFYYCKSLESVSFPNSLVIIAGCAFSECYKLDNITLPKNLTTIDISAFAGCESLKGITIPDSVQTIGFEAFERCLQLTNVVLPKNISVIEPSTFRSCCNLKSITIPSGVKSIRYEAFAYCENLTNIFIPSSVTTIEEGAFRYCSGLSSIYYGGNKEQWNKIYIETLNEPILKSAKHYNSTGLPRSAVASPLAVSLPEVKKREN